MYLLIENGQVAEHYEVLPYAWRNVSGLTLMSAEELAGLGWVPAALDVTPLGPYQRYGDWVFKQDITGWLAQREIVQIPQEQIVAVLTSTVQMHLDNVARQRGYDGILSACSYATSSHAAFKAEGQACVDWRDAVWSACYQIMGAVQAGDRAVPTEGELILLLPGMVWA
ncbi:MAG: hypothetical protein KKH74_06475 [Gammaproteobacteria bacterium]|nr:hypothetical protein [Gammaproteobacteria bacterium]MBU1732288.1 hypothetical protein [Gammaproteobacteria bacterium]MBU1893858.1 hypothetical protein [Gammaproteobacteria bacterium]